MYHIIITFLLKSKFRGNLKFRMQLLDTEARFSVSCPPHVRPEPVGISSTGVSGISAIVCTTGTVIMFIIKVKNPDWYFELTEQEPFWGFRFYLYY